MDTSLVLQENKKGVQVSSLKKILERITEKDSKIRIKLGVERLEPINAFLKVVWYEGESLLLQDETSRKFYAVESVSDICHFELDYSLPPYQTNKTYQIKR